MHLRNWTVTSGLGLLLLTGCGDLGTDPEAPANEPAMGTDMSVLFSDCPVDHCLPPIEGGGGDGDGGGECDPAEDPWNCECENENLTGGGETISSGTGGASTMSGCPGGGGSGPGDGSDPGEGGGGGSGSNGVPEDDCRPYLNPSCEHRYMNTWTTGELATLQMTVTRLHANGCHDISNALQQYAQDEMIGLWDARMYASGDPDQPRYGRVAVNEPAEEYYMFILAWSGANRRPDDGWNLHRTFAHEATHVAHPTWTHSQIEGYISGCLGDLYTPGKGGGNAS